MKKVTGPSYNLGYESFNHICDFIYPVITKNKGGCIVSCVDYKRSSICDFCNQIYLQTYKFYEKSFFQIIFKNSKKYVTSPWKTVPTLLAALLTELAISLKIPHGATTRGRYVINLNITILYMTPFLGRSWHLYKICPPQ